jgi:hypothetical protein
MPRDPLQALNRQTCDHWWMPMGLFHATLVLAGCAMLEAPFFLLLLLLPMACCTAAHPAHAAAYPRGVAVMCCLAVGQVLRLGGEALQAHRQQQGARVGRLLSLQYCQYNLRMGMGCYQPGLLTAGQC